jgi:3-oxoacyl-[acyl-carrier protein] reductase
MESKKFALVTGGSRGIGKAISKRLANMGYHVLINYRSNDAAAAETIAEIETNGGSASTLKFDIADKTTAREILDKWHQDNPKDCIEVLINNAGVRRDNLMVWMTDEEWNTVMDIHLNGFFVVTTEVLKKMIRNKYGRIINIVSLSGLKGMAGQTNYAAAKAGVIAATKSLAQEISRKKITVNCVAPGFIKTEMTEDINEADWKNFIPARRFGNVEEVAAVVEFLAGKEASYITGEVISVNGGLHM